MKGQTEVSIEVEILAGINFWIDTDTWASMDDDAKRAKIEAVITDIAGELSNDVVRFRTGNLLVSITGPVDDKIDLALVQTYCPDAET